MYSNLRRVPYTILAQWTFVVNFNAMGLDMNVSLGTIHIKMDKGVQKSGLE